MTFDTDFKIKRVYSGHWIFHYVVFLSRTGVKIYISQFLFRTCATKKNYVSSPLLSPHFSSEKKSISFLCWDKKDINS